MTIRVCVSIRGVTIGRLYRSLNHHSLMVKNNFRYKMFLQVQKKFPKAKHFWPRLLRSYFCFPITFHSLEITTQNQIANQILSTGIQLYRKCSQNRKKMIKLRKIPFFQINRNQKIFRNKFEWRPLNNIFKSWQGTFVNLSIWRRKEKC